MRKKYYFMFFFGFLLIAALWCAFFPTIQRALVTYVRNPTLIGSAEIPGLVEETLTLSINASEPVFTIHSYSGSVTIGVQGEAQINATTGQDGLYIYEYAFEKTKQPHYHWSNGFQIDNEVVTRFNFFPSGGMRSTTGETPYFSPKHQYWFLYDVGPTLRKISFKMQNENPQDVASQFIIQVSNGDKVFGFTR